MTERKRSGGAAGTLTGLDTETLPPLERGSTVDEPVIIGLTILCHPDPARIGEQAHLQPLMAGQTVRLSRKTPSFRNLDTNEERPLADPYLSRRGLKLLWRDGRLVISAESTTLPTMVDGAPLEGKRALEKEELKEGVVLEISGRVAILLHYLGMPRQRVQELGLVGRSEAIERVRADILRLGASQAAVLLRGESGTGKELVARAIHQQSRRRRGPYVSVNMAAVPPSTAASGLFGHVKGAFTGATSASSGFFGQADGGTIFLDEIGDTPLEIQVALLRALESGEIQPVGARQVRCVDVRLISATEAELEDAVRDGRFRAAFLHRISGYEIRLPALRERRDDIPRLLVHFLRRELAELGQEHKLERPKDRASRAALEPSLVGRLLRFDWPGNVRQLQNVARHIAIGSQDSPVLECPTTVERILAGQGLATPSGEQSDTNMTRQNVTEITDEELVEALRACAYRPGPAAARLGIGRTTIYKLIEESDSVRTAAELSDDELEGSWCRHDGDVEAMADELQVSLRALKLRLKRFEPSSQ